VDQPGRDITFAREPGARANQATFLSLLRRVRSHDPEAWRRMVELYRPLVLAWCGRGGVQGADAEDVAQEAAAAAALERFHRDRPGDTFRGWLRAITRNQLLLFYRRNRDHALAVGGSDAWHALQEVPDPLPGPGDEQSVEFGQLFLRALELVRGEFQDSTWQAFWRTVIEDREPAIVVDELGLTANNVRQLSPAFSAGCAKKSAIYSIEVLLLLPSFSSSCRAPRILVIRAPLPEHSVSF
jgi:RNA polymerase sigma-70 factor, ECF subfamily